MAERGGSRPGAGRPRGRKNKATAEQLATLEELAKAHTETALNALVSIAQASESDAARVSAANALLDRGYGKPKQSMELEHDVGDRLSDLLREIDGVSRGLPNRT